MSFGVTVRLSIAIYFFTFSILQLGRILDFFQNGYVSKISMSNVYSDANYLSTVLLAVFLAPILEELLFRKFLIWALLKIKFPTFFAIIFSSFVFSIMHNEQLNSRVIEIFSLYLTHFFLGVGLSLLYIRSGKIINSVLTHILHNFLVALPKPDLFYVGFNVSHTVILIYTLIYLSICALSLGQTYIIFRSKSTFFEYPK